MYLLPVLSRQRGNAKDIRVIRDHRCPTLVACFATGWGSSATEPQWQSSKTDNLLKSKAADKRVRSTQAKNGGAVGRSSVD